MRSHVRNREIHLEVHGRRGLLLPRCSRGNTAESSSLSQLCCDGVGIEIRVRDGGGGRRFGVCRHHMVEVLEHGFDLKRCLGVRILEAKQINSETATAVRAVGPNR